MNVAVIVECEMCELDVEEEGGTAYCKDCSEVLHEERHELLSAVALGVRLVAQIQVGGPTEPKDVDGFLKDARELLEAAGVDEQL